MINENKNGGLCNSKMAKSIAKILVKIGVSIKVFTIFLNMKVSNVYIVKTGD
jgi:hypothetical protein